MNKIRMINVLYLVFFKNNVIAIENLSEMNSVIPA